MKVVITKKVTSEVEVDINLIAKRLISGNIDSIVDNLIDEYLYEPESYIDKNIINIESDPSELSDYIREELYKILDRC